MGSETHEQLPSKEAKDGADVEARLASPQKAPEEGGFDGWMSVAGAYVIFAYADRECVVSDKTIRQLAHSFRQFWVRSFLLWVLGGSEHFL